MCHSLALLSHDAVQPSSPESSIPSSVSVWGDQAGGGGHRIEVNMSTILTILVDELLNHHFVLMLLISKINPRRSFSVQ